MSHQSTAQESLDSHQLLTILVVVDLVGLSKSTVLRMARSGLFPPSVELSPRLRRWRRLDVEKWLANRKPGQRLAADNAGETGKGGAA